MRALLVTISAILCLAPAHADVVNSASDGFELSLSRSSDRDVKTQFERIMRIAEWWSSEHTWSGDAKNLRITTLAAGGQWRETWDNGDIEHGRIIAGNRADNIWMVRFDAPLGPLQGMGVKAILTMEVEAQEAGGSEVRFHYLVTGASFQNLDQIAPVVDGVLVQQIESLVAKPANGALDTIPQLKSFDTPQN